MIAASTRSAPRPITSTCRSVTDLQYLARHLRPKKLRASQIARQYHASRDQPQEVLTSNQRRGTIAHRRCAFEVNQRHAYSVLRVDRTVIYYVLADLTTQRRIHGLETLLAGGVDLAIVE